MFDVVVAVLVVWGYVKLSRQIQTLERRVQQLEARRAAVPPLPAANAANAGTRPADAPWPDVHRGAAAPSNPVPGPAPMRPPVQDVTAVPAPRAMPRPDPWAPAAAKPVAPPSAWAQTADTLMGLVRKNPFASLGVLLLLVGVGFLFSLLAASNILPPALRVWLLAGAGAGVFGIGLKQEGPRYGLALNLQGGAMALEFLCVLWAYHGYGLLTSTTAFVLLGGLSTLSVGWATRKRRGLFVVMGLAGALGTPLFASTGQGVYSGLVLYGAWVSALGIASALRLGLPFLASAALAGLSVLLGAALCIPHGATLVTAVTLVVLTAAYCGAALFWVTRGQAWSARQQASVVGLLVGAPLVMAGLLHAGADLSVQACALVIGLAALADLVAIRVAPPAWRAGLLAMGAALGLVAIGVGLDGPSRALALSASALGLVMMARASDKPWAGLAALVYWGGSTLMGLDELRAGGALSAMPLGISGAVALAAGYLLRASPLGDLYTISAPVVLGLALLHQHLDEPMAIAVWGLVWAVLALSLAGGLRWAALRRSAAWLVPAGWVLYMADLPADWRDMDLVVREALLLGWLLAGGVLVWSLRLEAGVVAALTLLPPVLTSWELHRVLPLAGASSATVLMALMLLWCGWTLLVSVMRWDGKAMVAGALAAGWLVLNVLAARPGLSTEAAQWASLAALLVALRLRPEADIRRWGNAARGLAGAVLLGTALRAVGVAYGLDHGAWVLLFQRVMQPWVSLFWAAAGIAVVAYASRTDNRQLWTVGGAVILLLMAKMLLVDLSAFSLAAKVAVFMVIGLAFVALGYFCPLPPEDDDPADAEDDDPDTGRGVLLRR